MAEELIKKERELERLKFERKKELEHLREMRLEEADFEEEIRVANNYIISQVDTNKKHEIKILQIEDEIEFRRKHVNEIERKFSSIINSESKEAKKYIAELRNDIIKNKLEQVLLSKVPELQEIDNPSEDPEKMNEFHDLVFESVNIKYTKYHADDPTEKESEFSFFVNISKFSDFSLLKKTACDYFSIDSPEDYIITDEAEGYIYNEKAKINSYFQNYSVLNNMFRLIDINTFKIRQRLNDLQEIRMSDTCTISKKKKEKKGNTLNKNYDPNFSKIRDFILDYPSLKPYTATYLQNTDEQNLEIEELNKPPPSNSVETSFLFLVLVLIFYILTLLFIYSARDIEKDYLTESFLKQEFRKDNIRNYTEFYKFFNSKFAWLYFEKNINNNQNYTLIEADKRKNITKILGLENYVLDSNGTLNILKIYQLENERYKNSRFYITTAIRLNMMVVKTKACKINQISNTLVGKLDKCTHNRFDEHTNWKVGETFSVTNVPDVFYNMTKFKTNPNYVVSEDSISGLFAGVGFYMDLNPKTE